jgi:hypothetical protein
MPDRVYRARKARSMVMAAKGGVKSGGGAGLRGTGKGGAGKGGKKK